ncbi:hypothetical protein NM688_g4051 [Phlebia brevispora]|uniref:Uncharacterized protein n=1 Tax=Phlebia brevispora TaxID=194682 RepID=A0ACC1T3U3_9APHY|nr:hypothetical protein NM688_g4051 [Phlebia brevispora]
MSHEQYLEEQLHEMTGMISDVRQEVLSFRVKILSLEKDFQNIQQDIDQTRHSYLGVQECVEKLQREVEGRGKHLWKKEQQLHDDTNRNIDSVQCALQNRELRLNILAAQYTSLTEEVQELRSAITPTTSCDQLASVLQSKFSMLDHTIDGLLEKVEVMENNLETMICEPAAPLFVPSPELPLQNLRAEFLRCQDRLKSKVLNLSLYDGNFTNAMRYLENNLLTSLENRSSCLRRVVFATLLLIVSSAAILFITWNTSPPRPIWAETKKSTLLMLVIRIVWAVVSRAAYRWSR